MSTHPANEPANYTVKLASPIALTGEWEAALVSVQYSPTWMTFQNRITLAVFAIPDEDLDGKFVPHGAIYQPHAKIFTVTDELVAVPNKTYTEISQSLKDNDKLPSNLHFKVVHILPRYYATALDLGEELCRVLNNALKICNITLRYDYDFTTRKGYFTVYGGSVSISMENYMIFGELLGHEARWLPCGMCPSYSQRRHDSPHFYRLGLVSYREPRLSKVSSLWVYTNITEYQQVGDTKAPLLGIIPAQGVIGQRSHYTVNPINFLALNRNHIPEINIQITDDQGKRIPFHAGKNHENVVCCLRFRRRKMQPI